MRKNPNDFENGVKRPPPPPKPPPKRPVKIDIDVTMRHEKTVKEEILEECLSFFTDMQKHGSFYNSAIELDPNLCGDYCESEVKRLSARIVKALDK